MSVLGTTSGESAGISKVEELRAATTFGRPEAQLSQAAHDLKVGEEEVAAYQSNKFSRTNPKILTTSTAWRVSSIMSTAGKLG